MDYLLQRALELGAEKAKIIDPETVVVAEWVRWKCQYGCPLFEKDLFHPPLAPDAESMKKVLKEYSKAILLSGPNGQTLSEAAVRLEGEAYNQGYYKAFALVALVPGGGAVCCSAGLSPDPGAT
jgi:predicted metal-binding protein